MPRNEAKPLSQPQAMRAYTLRAKLTEAQTDGRRVSMTYTKRNGERSASTGTIAYFSGQDGMDTMAVTLDTPEKGRPTTVNLCRVHKAWPVQDEAPIADQTDPEDN